MANELAILSETFSVLGLGHEIEKGGISIKTGHAKTEFIGLDSIFFEFDENGEFKELTVVE